MGSSSNGASQFGTWLRAAEGPRRRSHSHGSSNDIGEGFSSKNTGVNEVIPVCPAPEKPEGWNGSEKSGQKDTLVELISADIAAPIEIIIDSNSRTSVKGANKGEFQLKRDQIPNEMLLDDSGTKIRNWIWGGPIMLRWYHMGI